MKSFVKGFVLFLVALCLLLFVIRLCSPLPSLAGRSVSSALFNTADTRLGQAITPLLEAHPGLAGVYPLPKSEDAFAARALLAQLAERTLDVQYYIWEKDITGTLLFDALRAAADRGVRVRLLLDDNNTAGLDPILAALNAHANIEVRLFNPFVIRKPRIGYLTDFFRANRRMHNKSFTVDNQVTIIGGRNIGDEYFGVAEGLLFVDLDVMAVGPVVTDVSKDFDRYWASASSYPVDRIVPPANARQIAEIKAAAERVETDPAAVSYLNALHDSPFVSALVERRLEFEWAGTRMVSDDPAKGLGRATPEQMFPSQLTEIIGEPGKQVDLVAAYFLPADTGANSFVAMAQRGVKIRVLTNSLAAADGPYVYAGYAKRRRALLQAGVTLYEMRRLSPHTESKNAGPLGSSGSSLHAKTFSVDRARIFIGSFNFDPRSRDLNTELGFVIDSPALAQKIDAGFERSIPLNAYELRVSNTGQLYWIERKENGELVRYDSEPAASRSQRLAAWFLSLLPIDWLL